VPNLTITYVVGTAIDVTLRIGAPLMDTGSVWRGTLTKSGGYQAEVDWDSNGGPTPYTVPGTYGYRRDLFGQSGAIVGSSVTLTNLPIILENTQFKGFAP
jgi:hypothetical protein